MDYAASLREQVQGIIAVDGKTMRGSHHRDNQVASRHIVSAWSEHNQLSLGQVKTDEKSNEITAIPRLLNQLDIWNQIITMDAMGAQRDICDQIRNKGGYYVIALKANQGTLYQDIKDYFEDETLPVRQEWEEYDKGHGRIEYRQCKVTDDIDWLQDHHQWPSLRTIACVYSKREFVNSDRPSTEEVRYYISSLPADAEQIAKAARKHWSIENQLHWVLDMTFNEDGSRIRNDNGPEIIAMIRKWALNIINQHKQKLSVKRMMARCAMDPKLLMDILNKI